MEGVGVVNGLLKVGCGPETLQKDDRDSKDEDWEESCGRRSWSVLEWVFVIEP
jgi:hypothetical protein